MISVLVGIVTYACLVILTMVWGIEVVPGEGNLLGQMIALAGLSAVVGAFHHAIAKRRE